MPCLPTVDGRVVELSVAALSVHQFTRRRTTRLLGLLALVLPTALPTFAAVTNYTWSPTFWGNSRWTRDSNWSGDNEPPANRASGLSNAAVTFAGSMKTSPILDENYYLRSVTFAVNASSFSLTPQSGQTLYLGAGGITNNSINTQSIYSALGVQADQTWLANAGQLNIGGVVNLVGDLTVAGNFNTTINNRIQGAGELIKSGTGLLTLSGTSANTFTGGVTINSGAVTVAKNNALGTGPLTLNGGVLNLGAYSLNVSSVSLLGGTINSSSGGLTSSADYQLQSGTVTTRLGGAGGLIKTTSGTVTLTAANTYTGGTQIRAGRLMVNNTTGSGTGSGPVLIGSGGLLTGTGTVTGFVTNAPGGSFSAGNEIGVLNLGSTIWFGGATNRWDLANATGAVGTGWDLLNINGTLTLSATALDQALIDLTSFTVGGVRGLAANFDPTQNYLWTFVQTSGGIIFQPGESAETIFELLTGNFANPTTGGLFGVALSADGRSLNITYNYAMPIPEPNMIAMTVLGLCGLIYGRRLRRNW